MQAVQRSESLSLTYSEINGSYGKSPDKHCRSYALITIFPYRTRFSNQYERVQNLEFNSENCMFLVKILSHVRVIWYFEVGE